MLTRLFDAILDAECHTEQETANFLRLGGGEAILVSSVVGDADSLVDAFPISSWLVMAIFACWNPGTTF